MYLSECLMKMWLSGAPDDENPLLCQGERTKGADVG